ncbi:MAG TPA: HAMP domain-containing sensor histidine kinase [Bacteroidia bacterium]|jgi:two-component system phosphate regulon sensor histidine kinase PhoR|nr:HAMP domain-containing sensor histidine kinase [Bacteroidia bacterium]
MGRNSIRLLILLAVVCIGGITVTQIYWVKKAFDLKETQFRVNVGLGLRVVSDSLTRVSPGTPDTTSMVNQLSSNYFVVNLPQQIPPAVLEHLLKKEFIKRGILFNFGLVIFNDDRMVYGKCITFNNTGMDSLAFRTLPDWKGKHKYMGIYFPGKDSSLAGQMNIWIFSSAVLLVVILFFSYTLFVILRQKRLSEIQRDFVNNMTHEFQTPISSILLSSQVLSNPEIVNTPARLNQYANLIHTEVSKLSSQVERVLNMSNMESDSIHLNREKVDIREVIETVKSRIIQTFPASSKAIQLHCLTEQTTLYADRIHLENMIYNLIENALKYSTETPEITLTIRNERQTLMIGVGDKGLGIPADEQKKIFRKFYRIPQGNRHDTKGFGLGLSYVDLLVKAHGGMIDVHSEPGKGSEFTLFFPQR